jgi:hypothetical protein
LNCPLDRGVYDITMTVPIWLWLDLHRSRNWPWLNNVSTSGSLAKGKDYKKFATNLNTNHKKTLSSYSPVEVFKEAVHLPLDCAIH